SAGNNGSAANTVQAPGAGYNTLVVGALGEYAAFATDPMAFNLAADFSGRGPTRFNLPTDPLDTTGTNKGNVRARVDIAAPGVQIRSATYDSAAPNSVEYGNGSGTSFAAPV